VNPAHDVSVDGIGVSTNDVSACPICPCQPLAKYRDAPTESGENSSKSKRKINGERKGIGWPKKKLRIRLKDEEFDTTNSDQVILDE
jgi:hypothetical protein